jgi:hypothetical protein
MSPFVPSKLIFQLTDTPLVLRIMLNRSGTFNMHYSKGNLGANPSIFSHSTLSRLVPPGPGSSDDVLSALLEHGD